jgi:hypothetical protein
VAEAPAPDAKTGDLLEVLIENKIISSGQAQVVRTDHTATGMPIEEILMARRWANQETISKYAPAVKKTEAPKADNKSEKTEQSDYEKHLKEYRSLMTEIMGKPVD